MDGLAAHRRAFLVFGLIGVVGFAVDAGALYAAMAAGLDPYTGRIVSYLIAATVTWLLNRRFTFAAVRGEGRTAAAEWLRYVLVNGIGGGVNVALYSAVVYVAPPHALVPLAGLVVGSGCAWVINYALSHLLVFRQRA